MAMRKSFLPSAGAVAAVYFSCGCDGDVRFGGQQARRVEVRPVTHYGLTLDAAASPEQVAYAGLRAIADDVQARDPKARTSAIDAQFDLAAANAIAKKNRTKLDDSVYIHDVVYHWAPTVAYYVADFPKSWEAAQERLVRRPDPGDSGTIELAMVVADPSGDPNARVVMLIWLTKDNSLWRVLHFGFDHDQRSLTVAQG